MNDADRLNCPPVGPAELDEIWDALDGPYDGRHYDRAGNKISMRDWVRLRHWDALENERKYTIIEQTTIGDYLISTVWLGLDHSFGYGPPLIFETMVFKGGESDLDCERYSTEEEALAGHAAICEKVGLFAELSG